MQFSINGNFTTVNNTRIDCRTHQMDRARPIAAAATMAICTGRTLRGVALDCESGCSLVVRG